MTKQNIVHLNPEDLPNTQELGYSQISIVDTRRLAFVSGQSAWNTVGTPIPEALCAQTEMALEHVRGVLDSLNADCDDIVKLRCHVTDLSTDRMAEIVPVIQEFLDGAAPTVSMLGVAALPHEDLQIVFELVVQVPD